MSVDNESLKRVLMSIKGAARGFKKDKLQGRLAPKPMEDVANPLDAAPEDPLVVPAGLEGDADEAAEGPMVEGVEEDAAAKLEAIRKLIGSV